MHLLANDTPFNKNRDSHAKSYRLGPGARIRDRWEWDRGVRPDKVDAVQDDWPAMRQVICVAKAASRQDSATFPCWLGVRLMETHRSLTTTSTSNYTSTTARTLGRRR